MGNNNRETTLQLLLANPSPQLCFCSPRLTQLHTPLFVFCPLLLSPFQTSFKFLYNIHLHILLFSILFHLHVYIFISFHWHVSAFTISFGKNPFFYYSTNFKFHFDILLFTISFHVDFIFVLFHLLNSHFIEVLFTFHSRSHFISL